MVLNSTSHTGLGAIFHSSAGTKFSPGAFLLGKRCKRCIKSSHSSFSRNLNLGSWGTLLWSSRHSWLQGTWSYTESSVVHSQHFLQLLQYHPISLDPALSLERHVRSAEWHCEHLTLAALPSKPIKCSKADSMSSGLSTSCKARRRVNLHSLASRA